MRGAKRAAHMHRRVMEFARRERLIELLQAIITTSIDRRIDVQAAQLAFNGVYSIGPLLAVATSALSLVPRQFVREDVLPHVLPAFPSAVRPLMTELLTRPPRPPSMVLVILGSLGLLWTLSSAVGSIHTALESLGWKSVTGIVRGRLRGALLGVLASIGLAGAALSIAVGPSVLSFLGRVLHFDGAWVLSLAWVRWPTITLFYAVAAGLTYRYGSAHRPLWRSVFVGAATAGAVCVASSYGLSILFGYVPNMGGAHGAASGVFATLFWLYVMSLGLMLGAVVTQAHETSQLGEAPRRGTHRAIRERAKVRALKRARARRPKGRNGGATTTQQ